MRTHRDIIKAYGASELVRALRGRNVDIKKSTPQRWADRDSIPGEYWEDVVALGAATMDELAGAAKAKLPQIGDGLQEAAA